MKHLQKLLSNIMMGVMVLGLFGFTGCSFFGGNNHFSRTQLKKLEDTVEPLVQDYFNEKYGVKAVVTYKSVAGGVFLGSDPSAVQYYLVTLNISDDVENVYYVNLYGREVNGIDELYVKSDSYYGLIIKERMEKWLDGYMKETNIDEYYIYYQPSISGFPCEYEVTATAEEIIKSVSSIEGRKERDLVYLFI